MGADLLVTMAVIDKDKEPDWDAGHRWVDLAPDDLIAHVYEEATGDDMASVTDAREAAHGYVDELKNLVEGGARDFMCFEIRGATVYLSGGMSWGDSPTDAFEVLNNVGYFFDWDYEAHEPGPAGSLMGAMGFEV